MFDNFMEIVHFCTLYQKSINEKTNLNFTYRYFCDFMQKNKSKKFR